MDPHFSKEIIVKETTEPSAPGAGYVYVYAKSDGLLYSKDDAGVETAMGGGSNSLYAERSYYEGNTPLAVGTYPFMVARTAMTITRIDAEVDATPLNPPHVYLYKNGASFSAGVTIDGGPNYDGNRHKSTSVSLSVAAGDRLELVVSDDGGYMGSNQAEGPLIIGIEFNRA